MRSNRQLRSSEKIAAVAIVALAALTSCSSSSSKSAAPTSTSQPTATTTTVAPLPKTAPASFAQLEARLITKVPAGYVLQPDRNYDTGPSTLAKAIKDDGSPIAGRVFRTEKFVRGYERAWVGPDHGHIIVFVYQFKTVAGARLDYTRAARRSDSHAPHGAPRFAIAGLPRGRSFGAAGLTKNGTVAVAVFTIGVFHVQVACTGPRTRTLVGTLRARAIAIANDQAARL